MISGIWLFHFNELKVDGRVSFTSTKKPTYKNKTTHLKTKERAYNSKETMRGIYKDKQNTMFTS